MGSLSLANEASMSKPSSMLDIPLIIDRIDGVGEMSPFTITSLGVTSDTSLMFKSGGVATNGILIGLYF